MELPYPPTVNNYLSCKRSANSKKSRFTIQAGKLTLVKSGIKRVLTPEAKEYKDTIAWEVRLSGFNQPIDTPVVVWIELYPPDNRVRDTDNTQKAIFDALQYAGVITNDKFIVEHHVKMFPKHEPDGCIYVTMLDAKESTWKLKKQ